MKELLEAATKQATNFGEQVRTLEDQNQQEARKGIRAKWMAFAKTCRGTSLEEPILDAYYEAYCKE